MRSTRLKLAIAMTLLTVPSAGCVRTAIRTGVPDCDRLISPVLLRRVEPVELPVSEKLPDGHDDARPWQKGFIGQTGQLERESDNKEAVAYSYSECLKQAMAADKRAKPKLFGIF